MANTTPLTRRRFLGRSATVAAAAAAGPALLARGVHAAGSDEIRVALIGCGGRGVGAAANCLNVPGNMKLVAVADAFEAPARSAAERLAAEYGDKVDVPPERIFTGFDGYHQAIASDVDLVLLVAPPGFRPAHYAAAVQAGKHVFMEKPVCVDAPGYRSVMESNRLADEMNLKVVVGLQSRHDPQNIETIKRIHDGALGETTYLTAHRNMGWLWVRPRRPEDTEMQYQMRNWYYFVWLSGDQIVEMHVHHLDRINWAMRDQHPVKANGMGGRQVRKGPEHGQIYDHQFVEFTYADGTQFFSQNRMMPNCWNASSQMIHGTKGSSNCTGSIAGENAWEYDGPRVNATDEEHVNLVRAIREDTPHNEGYYGADSSFTAVLGRMATYSGQEVHWDEAVAGGPDEMPADLAWDAAPPVLPDDSGSYEHAVATPGIYRAY
jgi:myo-inositol 2-dehydrogenase / D-chiro-inositol 1-dehydrogenase